MAPPTTPAATPGPHPGRRHPHPGPRQPHWAEASVAVAATVAVSIATASRAVSLFFIGIFLERLVKARLDAAHSELLEITASHPHAHVRVDSYQFFLPRSMLP